MNLLGTALAAVAAAALVLAFRGPSAVGKYLDALSPDPGPPRLSVRIMNETDLRHAALAVGPDELLAIRIASAGSAALGTGLLGLVLPLGPVFILAIGYFGWIAPSLVVARRAAAARVDAERSTIVLVERLCALMAAGRPAESALGTLLRRPTGSRLLDGTLRAVNDSYLLGGPLFRTLARASRSEDLEQCAGLADDLERARDLGAASTAIVRERRSALRDLERSRVLAAASTVEAKLMLVLVLCYLPALMLIAIIPLFMSLLSGLGV